MDNPLTWDFRYPYLGILRVFILKAYTESIQLKVRGYHNSRFSLRESSRCLKEYMLINTLISIAKILALPRDNAPRPQDRSSIEAAYTHYPDVMLRLCYYSQSIRHFITLLYANYLGIMLTDHTTDYHQVILSAAYRLITLHALAEMLAY